MKPRTTHTHTCRQTDKQEPQPKIKQIHSSATQDAHSLLPSSQETHHTRTDTPTNQIEGEVVWVDRKVVGKYFLHILDNLSSTHVII